MSKVSFVIPVYDGDSYLAETIESIRKQSLKDIEIVVIDDCSPDFTQDLMEWYIKQDDRIKYYRFETNFGVREARNYGNRMSNSELICVSDQDDISTYHRADYSYKFFKEHPEIDCLTSNYWECNVDGEKVKKYLAPQMTREVFESQNFVWFHSSACYRKKDILEMPYKDNDNSSTDDWDFLDDWTKSGKKFFNTKKVLANCRRLPWGQMAQRRMVAGSGKNYIL